MAQAESTALNPSLDPQIVADALEADPASASAEWLAISEPISKSS